MQNTFLDLRWILLENLTSIENLANWYRGLLFIFFVIFSLTSFVNFLAIYLPSISKKKYLLSNITFIISLILFIIAGRWPGLLPSMLNPDEAQFIAAAMKLLKEPLFWHSIDTGSSGPINVYPLMLPALFGFRLEYASARVIGLILVFISIISLYYSLELLYNRSLARLVTFLLAVTFATMRFPDYIHYSSEHIPIAILSICLLIICYGYSRQANNNNLIFLSGMLLGLIPYAKMQGVPMALSLGVMAFYVIWTKSPQNKSQLLKSWAAFILGLPIPSIIIFIYLKVFSIFDDFWKSYIQQNLLFYSTSYAEKSQTGLLTNIIAFVKFIRTPPETNLVFVLTTLILFLVLPFLITIHHFYLPKRKGSKTFPFVYYSLFILLATLYAVTKPGTNYGHYLLFLIIPSGFFLGVCLGELQLLSQNISLKHYFYKLSLKIIIVLSILLTLGSCFQIYQAINKNNFYIANKTNFLRKYTSPLEQAILKYASPGNTLVVWGWANQLYVNTGMTQGVRDGGILWQLFPNTLQSYYQKRFLNDWQNSNSEIFVDAVAPKMFYFNNPKTQGHQVIPEIANFVNQNYKLVEEVEGVRIYTRLNK